MRSAFGDSDTVIQDLEAQLKVQGKSEEEIRRIQVENLINSPDSAVPLDDGVLDYSQILIRREKVLGALQEVKGVFVEMGEDQLISQLKVIKYIEVRIKKAKVNLLHHQSFVCLGYFDLDDVVHNIELTQLAKFNFCEIGDIQFYDISGYPNTIDTEKVDPTQIKPQRILNRVDGNTKKMA